MRIVTWNCCRGAYAKKVPLLEALAPDIAVIQECAKPLAESEQCLWFGDNPRQGLAVQAYGGYQLHPLPVLLEAPKYVVPIEVSGPRRFTLFAIWTLGNQEFRYVEAAAKAVDLYRDVISASATVLIGDFNSNTIWDSTHPPELNHSALVRRLHGLGIVSAYHHMRGEAHGEESLPTFYFHWKQGRPFHIDYCFVPEAWADQIRTVEVGSYEDWRAYSDHRPLVVEITSSSV